MVRVRASDGADRVALQDSQLVLVVAADQLNSLRPVFRMARAGNEDDLDVECRGNNSIGRACLIPAEGSELQLR